MFATALLATAISQASAAPASAIEEVTVEGEKITAKAVNVADLPSPTRADASALLTRHAGVNANSNGPLTSVLQIRGLTGDRVTLNIDGISPAGGGPNAMDSPLSYAGTPFIESSSHYRGISPVSAGAEAPGGAASMQTWAPASDSGWNGQATVQAGSASAQSTTLRAGFGGTDGFLGLRANSASADDLPAAGDYRTSDLQATRFERDIAELVGGASIGAFSFTASVASLETGETGTPALPMDIIVIDSDRWQLQGKYQTALGEFSLRAAGQEVFHRMDNFQLRSNTNPMRHRSTDADGDMSLLSLEWQKDNWQAGIELREEDHSAVVGNPNNPMFFINNFSDVQRERESAFVEYTPTIGKSEWQVGVRASTVDLSAGSVSANMPMMSGGMSSGMNGGMMDMQGAVNMLAMQFNNGERALDHNLIDSVVQVNLPLTEQVSLTLGAAHKERAPSYQESFLWLPMEATGGLGDGYTYIGNTSLNKERQNELLAGISWQQAEWQLYASAWVRDITDYIQGTPVTGNMAANMVGTMMSGKAPLQFDNTDARIRGIELEYQARLGERWYGNARVAYAHGENTSLDEPLYRLAPLEAVTELGYLSGPLQAELQLVARARQDRVSEINAEMETAGHALLNLSAAYRLGEHWQLRAGIENLLDRDHANHLGGIYRPADGTVAQGSRIPGIGRTWQLGLSASW